MAKKKDEVKEEITTKKKELGYLKLFRELNTENPEDNFNICAIASQHLLTEFNCKIGPEACGVIFNITFRNIIETLQEEFVKAKDKIRMGVNIGKRLDITISTSNSDDFEKSGNFVMGFTHLNNKALNTNFDSDLLTIQKFVLFHEENCEDNANFISTVESKTVKDLVPYGIQITATASVLGIFIFVYDALIKYTCQKRLENARLSEFPDECYGHVIRFLQTVEVNVMENPDGPDDNIEIISSITAKTSTKDDEKAAERSLED